MHFNGKNKNTEFKQHFVLKRLGESNSNFKGQLIRNIVNTTQYSKYGAI